MTDMMPSQPNHMMTGAKDPDHDNIPKHFIDINPANKGKLTAKEKEAGTASKSGKPTVAGDDKIKENPNSSTKAKEEAQFDLNRRKWQHK